MPYTSNHLRAVSSCQGYTWCPPFVLDFSVRNQRNRTRNANEFRLNVGVTGCQDVLSARDVPSSTLKPQVGEPREVSPWIIGAADSKTRPAPAVTSPVGIRRDGCVRWTNHDERCGDAEGEEDAKREWWNGEGEQSRRRRKRLRTEERE